MSKIFLHLQKVHVLVHDLQINSFQNLLNEKNYSVPKIFTGGVNITLWSKLSEHDKKIALAKNWYIYYSFRDTETGKLKRMPNVKGGANRLKTKNERIKYLNTMRDALELLLEKGFIPYEDNDVELLLDNKKTGVAIDKKVNASKNAAIISQNDTIATNNEVVAITDSTVATTNCLSIKDAFDFALKIKKNSIGETGYKNFELRIRKFKKSLDESQPITFITKKIIIL